MSAPWWTKVVCCPRCDGALSAASEDDASSGLVRCAACGPYPVLAGVPVLVVDPLGYCRAFRDSILATLAEHDAADREAVAIVDAFARGGGSTEIFSDDWTAHEAVGAQPPEGVKGPSQATLLKLVRESAVSGPAAWLREQLEGVTKKIVLELGCGAGERSEVIASKQAKLLIGDRSLRAVLQARRRARSEHPEEDVDGVVLDAMELPIRARSVDVMVAEHLVDLLDEPSEFFARAKHALRRGGRLLVTSPEPSLGTEDDDALVALAREAKFKIVERRDGLPWLRVNSSRFVELYLVQALELRA